MAVELLALVVIGCVVFFIFMMMRATRLVQAKYEPWRMESIQLHGVERIYIVHGLQKDRVLIGRVALDDPLYSDKAIQLYSEAEDKANERNSVRKLLK